ncbi:MAG: GatB/YqeY domain-containing protein [Bacteroidales bacterium]|nr:GatB/YqeY domain-containing protein [Bacteroidales bacterium]MCF8344848.1 GatB/YqeY domain-containing protein [Bacteroidales bacterium]MCF8377442.1 GatB/YqeY domain-containing protein [Bacteroidales bacterium]MCF8401654.1 GatB/YqeY domain-containing protein [Bacteroidales bacterium]
MSLEQTINSDLKEAMKARDSKKLEALRAVKSAILLAKTEKKAAGQELARDVEMSILQKLVKQRKESAQIYREKNRNELAEQEEQQAKVIEEYLPKQMSEEEIEAEINKIINETGAESIRDMGKVMGIASKRFAGKADNKTVAAKVKEMLG